MNDYEEGRLGRKRAWVSFESALKMLKRNESVTILIEGLAAAKMHRKKIEEIGFKSK